MSARHLIAALVGTVLAQGFAVVYLALERANPDPDDLVELALDSDEVKNAAIERLVEGGEGAWDSYTDPDVGRVMQRNAKGREFRGVKVSSNEYGMRERSYSLAKPAGTTRIVLLGDSFVFGYGAEAEDRLGVFLERFLRERAGAEAVECLHLAATSWNVLAETSYLRRQLHLLRPDLVVQVVVVNDLDDCKGVRGFGALGAYSPQVRERAGGLVSQLSPPQLYPRRVQTYLLFGLDDESRDRYARASVELARLAHAVEDQGGTYLMLAAWESFNPMVEKHLRTGLTDDQVAYVSLQFTQDERYRHDETDRHWNRAGHERIAMLLYGLARERSLLPGLDLEPWPEADEAVRAIHEPGRLEALQVAAYDAALLQVAREQARPSIDFTSLDRLGAKQVHGGVLAEGAVAPYASLFLARGDGDELVLRGRRYGSPALGGATATVSVEGIEVGRLALSADELAIDAHWPLPPETLSRPFVTVRIVSDDYVYTNVENGSCAAFRLDELRIE